MKKFLAFIFGIALFGVMMVGCTGTGSTVTEYDPVTGKVLKVTTTTESVASTVVSSTKDKVVAVYDNSFLAYISASTATTEDPTPTLKFALGKSDKGVLTMPKECDQRYASKIVEAMRAGDITMSATGVSYGTEAVEEADAVDTVSTTAATSAATDTLSTTLLSASESAKELNDALDAQSTAWKAAEAAAAKIKTEADTADAVSATNSENGAATSNP